MTSPSVGGPGWSGVASSRGTLGPSASPAWMADGQFAVQVVMWNPGVFPAVPEQHTNGLSVMLQPNGVVLTTPYGTDQGGMTIWHEISTNGAGQRVIRFPFAIPGLGD